MTDVTIYQPPEPPAARFSPSQLELLKETVARGTTDSQFRLFVEVAQASGLNPFARQIYAVVRNGQMTIQTGVDGYRLIAQRTGEYSGQLGPFWCGADGEWRDVWLSNDAPMAAKVGVLRRGYQEPVWGVARTSAYRQGNSPLWNSMPDVMIAKCAEVLALRKAFPQELSGLYSDAEMDQAGPPDPMPPARPANQAPPARSTARRATVPAPAQDTPPAPREEPAISRFWRDVRALGIQREEVVEHLGHDKFETLDDDQLGELLIQLREKHQQGRLDA